MRNTKNKESILAVLRHTGPEDFFERGTPPYSVAEVARTLGADLSNTAKTLKLLENEGLVVREVATKLVWNGISKDHEQRRCVCYWVAATLDADREAARAWHDGAEARSDGAADRIFARFAAQAAQST